MLKPFFQDRLMEAGCDEAGRGCLAGPVFAGAVILPRNFRHPLLNDSKQLSEKNRILLRGVIEKQALAFAVASLDPEIIDEINILQASFSAMHLALDQLSIVPELILVDGNRFKPYASVPHQTIIKGDGIYASIAAASILAKTYRDEAMEQLHSLHPQYGWLENKGYPTRKHREAIQEYGMTPFHRKSFQCLPPTND